MNNKIIRKVISGFTLLCIIATIISLHYKTLLKLYVSYKFNTDFSDISCIGIIGGSDGPTTIYLSTSNSPYITPTVLFALLSITGIAYLIITKKKQNKQK